jgi:hypothetical protein
MIKMAVSVAHKFRPNLSRFTFVFLGLAIAVFAWGLQYKLSLYDPPHSTSHQIPEAKLLSRDEQATVVEGLFVSGDEAGPGIAHILPFSLLAFVVLGLFPRIFRRLGRQAKRPWRVSCRPGLNAFFFRPPPSLTSIPS